MLISEFTHADKVAQAFNVLRELGSNPQHHEKTGYIPSSMALLPHGGVDYALNLPLFFAPTHEEMRDHLHNAVRNMNAMINTSHTGIKAFMKFVKDEFAPDAIVSYITKDDDGYRASIITPLRVLFTLVCSEGVDSEIRVTAYYLNLHENEVEKLPSFFHPQVAVLKR